MVKMSDMEFTRLMHGKAFLKNEKGEVVFKMKRKEGYGSVYYIFEKNEEAMSDEMKAEFPEAFEVMCMGARMLGIPFYDFNELTDGVNGQILATLKTKEAIRAMEKANRTGKIVLVRDIDVKIFDHGTRKINTITVGVSVPPGGEEYVKKLLKVMEMEGKL